MRTGVRTCTQTVYHHIMACLFGSLREKPTIYAECSVHSIDGGENVTAESTICFNFQTVKRNFPETHTPQRRTAAKTILHGVHHM